MAITFDNNASGEASSASFTVGANSNRTLVLFVSIQASNNGGSGAFQTPSYGSSNFTLIDSQSPGGISQGLSSWYLIAPSTGANTLTLPSIGLNYASQIFYAIYSYYNTSQTFQPDAHSTNFAISGSSTISTTTTTVAANSLIVSYGCDMSGSIPGTTTVGTNHVLTQTNHGKSGDFGVLTSGGTGETSSIAYAGNPRGLLGVSLAPFVAASANGNFLMFM